MTDAGRNMDYAYTSDVEEILTFKISKILKSMLRVRLLITSRKTKILKRRISQRFFFTLSAPNYFRIIFKSESSSTCTYTYVYV
jgi:hypothetical protein